MMDGGTVKTLAYNSTSGTGANVANWAPSESFKVLQLSTRLSQNGLCCATVKL